MNQRYDLFAFSLLIFSVVLVIWIGVAPISAESLKQWQTLAGGLVTGLGIVIASWNVTRQMRLAARGREQDRIERELPGLRAAAFFLARFAIAMGKDPKAETLLAEFGEVELNSTKIADFLAKAIEALPVTPDVIKREVAMELFRLRAASARVVRREGELSRTRAYFRAQEAAGSQDLARPRTQLAAAEMRFDEAKERFEKALEEFTAYREKLVKRIKSEVKKSDILRAKLERSLAIND